MSLLNSLDTIFSNLVISQTSSTSNNSDKNNTSLAEFANGQNLKRPSTN